MHYLHTRSALEWIVDQYRHETHEETGVVSDPNDPTDEQFIIRLIERITTVSLATVELIKGLPAELEFVAFSADKTVEVLK
jgi:predicted helicase